MTKYAEGTRVSVSDSQAEIERTLVRFSCDQRAWMRDDTAQNITLLFGRKGVSYRLTMPLKVPFGTSKLAQEAEIRRRLRVVLIWVKAQCEMVDTGLLTFEQAFMPQVALPGGHTVGETFQPQIAAMLADGRAPTLALALPSGQQHA